jgi:hypothetical protein
MSKQEKSHRFDYLHFLLGTVKFFVDGILGIPKKGTGTSFSLTLRFNWNPKDKWNEMYANFLEFKISFGHCNVPREWQSAPELSHRVGVQRRNYSKGKMNHEHITGLNEIGFVWEPIDTSWSEMFSELIKFNELNGHCRVPQRFAENSKLGRWVARQRKSIRRKQLISERARLLEEIGFE